MPRRGRSPSPSRPIPRSAPARAPAPVQQTMPAHPPPSLPAQAPVAQQQPSLFKQMAATAGGVAVGSAIGHTIGHGLTGMLSGGGGNEVAAQPAAPAPVGTAPYAPAGSQEPVGPCAWEIKEFLKCAQEQSDLTLCDGFNEAIRQCKTANRMV